MTEFSISSQGESDLITDDKGRNVMQTHWPSRFASVSGHKHGNHWDATATHEDGSEVTVCTKNMYNVRKGNGRG